MKYIPDLTRQYKVVPHVRLGVGPGFFSLIEYNHKGGSLVLDRDNQLWMAIPGSSGVAMYPMKKELV